MFWRSFRRILVGRKHIQFFLSNRKKDIQSGSLRLKHRRLRLVHLILRVVKETISLETKLYRVIVVCCLYPPLFSREYNVRTLYHTQTTGITCTIMTKMISTKVEYLFKIKKEFQARFTTCFQNWWLRSKSEPEKAHFECIESFKSLLCWNEKRGDTTWLDRDGIPLLIYAVIRNDVRLVRNIFSLSVTSTFHHYILRLGTNLTEM